MAKHGDDAKIRILAVENILRRKQKTTANKIMRELELHYGIEVDRKTIYSDVAAINRFISIEVTYGPNGGYQWVDVLRGAECE
jgi:predicted DNA-binding transcriptional regulator YafY